jgi:hypothetical protein
MRASNRRPVVFLFQCMPGSFLPVVPTRSVYHAYASIVCLAPPAKVHQPFRHARRSMRRAIASLACHHPKAPHAAAESDWASITASCCWHPKLSRGHNRYYHHVSIIKMAREHTRYVDNQKCPFCEVVKMCNRLHHCIPLIEMVKKTYMEHPIWGPDERVMPPRKYLFRLPVLLVRDQLVRKWTTGTSGPWPELSMAGGGRHSLVWKW